MKKITANPKIYSFAEALADISYIAGTKGFYGGNSREDIANFITWAEEFEQINKGVEWGISENPDYIDAITEFTEKKIKENTQEEEETAQKSPTILKALEDLLFQFKEDLEERELLNNLPNGAWKNAIKNAEKEIKKATGKV